MGRTIGSNTRSKGTFTLPLLKGGALNQIHERRRRWRANRRSLLLRLCFVILYRLAPRIFSLTITTTFGTISTTGGHSQFQRLLVLSPPFGFAIVLLYKIAISTLFFVPPASLPAPDPHGSGI